MKSTRAWTAAAVLALTACGTGSDTGATNGAVPVGGATGKELAAAQVLHIGNGAEIQTLDPQRGEEVQGSNIQRDLFEGLISEAPNGDLVPGVAETWSISDDGKTIRIPLAARREMVQRRPRDGRRLRLRNAPRRRSRDVVRIQLHPGADRECRRHHGRQEAAERARRARARRLHARNRSREPDALFPRAARSQHDLSVASCQCREIRRSVHASRQSRVSNGAYKLDEWVVHSYIKAVRNPYYWDNEHTTIDEVCYYPINDQDAELQALSRRRARSRPTSSRRRNWAGFATICRRSSSSRRISARTTTAST